MKHIHLKACDSTQKYLCELEVDSDIDYLVSTEAQTQGIGRHGNTWLSDNGSLCFSFTILENEILSLTSIEIGLILTKYFDGLKVKWPNDLLNEKGQKCGGILINKKGDQKPVVGIGLNLNSSQFEVNSKIKPGAILETKNEINQKQMSLDIFNFIKENRLNKNEVYSLWETKCYHHNKQVILIDGDQSFEGTFLGIGKFGEAIININGLEKKFVSGSIRFKS